MSAKQSVLAGILLFTVTLSAQTPQWIWSPDTNAPTVYLRKTFRTPPLTWNARLTVTADDRAEVYLNGVSVGHCSDWQQPIRSEVSVRLNQGENVLAIKAENTSGATGALAHFNVNGETNIVTDSSWLTSTREQKNWSTLAFNAADWLPARTVGTHGAPPWGDVLFQAGATPAENLKVLDGFKVELLRSAAPGEGSWICMTFDDRGRLIVSPQGDERPLLRLTLADGQVAKVEKIAAPVRYAMGLLYAFGSLYANANGPSGSGLYRLIDANKNDQFETNELHLLKRFQGGSEHGYHALSLGPDGKIYVLNGNGTKLPDGVSPNSPYRNYAEDALSGNRGNDEDQDGSKAPACHVLQTDPNGKEWKLWAGGMRNAYDMDFNEAGELFTFDSDMEWDWGTPWYRPTRILHLVSGGDYGWRDGTRMWADYFPDCWPAVTPIGIGSPTGVKFGTKSHFPERYRRALYAMDWSYGRIVAVHFTETKSTYNGQWETFLQGTPLNLTSLAFGPDGAMYFITGGRGTQSGLYRVSSSRPNSRPDREAVNGIAIASRELRHKLEGLQAKPDPDMLEFIVGQLHSANDLYILNAARVALEALPVDLWKRRALLSKSGVSGPLAMLLALTRAGGADGALEAVERAVALHGINVWSLRIIEIALSRYPELQNRIPDSVRSKLERAFPSKDPRANRELCRILLRLETPDAVHSSIRLLESATAQEDQLFYIEQLRNVREGWSVDDRRAYFTWFVKSREKAAHSPELIQYFKDVGRGYVDGAWFDRYVRDFRRQTIATLTAAERYQVEPLLSRPVHQAQSIPGRLREFVREWKMEDLLPEIGKHQPNLSRGRQALADAQCLSCHRFGNDGGLAGPELTGVGSKYTARDLLESIIEPSKVLSDQYQDHTALMKDGENISGRLISESENEIVIETDRLNGTTEKLKRANVTQLKPSPLSPMPKGLVNVLTREEILDLVAYLHGVGPVGPH